MKMNAKIKAVSIAILAILFVTGSALAQMADLGGGAGGMGGGMGDGHHGWSSAGPGYGTHGGLRMMPRLYRNTLNQAYLEVLEPIGTAPEAVTAVQAFLDSTRSNLTIDTVWEYNTAFKAELVDTQGQKAFDILADKLTGAVMPEMGFSMMMNASWGHKLSKTRAFGASLVLTPEDATAAAEAFLANNATVLDYTIDVPEIYPGYYRFHTMDTAGNPGMDIMVNGYNGRIWMNTLLGAPIAGPVTP